MLEHLVRLPVPVTAVVVGLTALLQAMESWQPVKELLGVERELSLCQSCQHLLEISR